MARSETRVQRARKRRAFIGLLLDFARERSGHYNRLSNQSWLISSVAAAGGTLLAVGNIYRAISWGELVDQLESAMLDATIELRIAEELASRPQALAGT